MGLEAALIGEAQHLVVHAGGVAYAQHIDAAVDQLLAYPVHGGVALCADHHLALAHQRLVDGFHESGGLAGAGRAMHHLHVLGLQHLVDGFLLCGVEPREAHGLEGERLGGLVAVEEVAQIGQPVVLGANHTVEGVEHHAVGGLVEEQLHAHGIGAALDVELVSLWHGHDHAVAVDIAHLGGEREVAQGFVLVHGEEHHGLAKLEVVLDVGVGGARHLQGHLVERIVGAAAHGEGKPRVATLHLAPHSHRLRLLAIGFLLRCVFHLEQRALLLQCLYWRDHLVHISAKIEKIFRFAACLAAISWWGACFFPREAAPMRSRKSLWHGVCDGDGALVRMLAGSPSLRPLMSYKFLRPVF